MLQRAPGTFLRKKHIPGLLDEMGFGSTGQGTGTEVTLQPSFWAPLSDAGAGAVNIVLARGVGAGTFTRATTATTIGSTGLVTSVGTGVPRSTYDPTTLTYLGYLAEGARTNLCLQSEDFATTWTNTTSTETVNAAIAPDGNTTADKLIPNAAGNGALVQSIVQTANQTYTISVFAKTAEFNLIQLLADSGAGADTAKVTYDATTGGVSVAASVTGAWTAPSSTAKQYANGWWRFTLTYTCTTNAGANIQCWCRNTGDGTSGIYLWGAQLEQASFSSSYIPTTTVAVTRNADVLTYPFAGNASGTIGSCYAELSYFQGAVAAASSTAIAFDAGTSWPLGIGATSASTTTLIRDGTNVVPKTGLDDLLTDVRKRASSWNTALAVTGAGLTPATGVFDGNIGSTAVALGCTTSGISNWFGTIRNVRIWQRQLGDTTLQSLTA